MAFSMENRPLKKLKLGPPDVYPQDPRQKEDELTPVNVKQGFSHTPNLHQTEEYGSAKNHNFSLAKVQNFINGVLTKKQEINTLPDTGRKRQIINPKENFHNVTPKSKAFIESWFKDLAGSKPLATLGKRVPIFNKKEEIFMQLSEYQVPTLRALWLLKMTSAYSVTISEAKMKKRQVPDSSQEWTSTLVRFIKEQLLKLQDFYQKVGNAGNITALVSNAADYHNGNPAMTDEQKLSLRQFNYCQPLCKVMFEEGLLECQDFLQWQLDMLEKCKSCDDGLLKLIIPFILQYIDEFTQCEILSRRLAFQVCKRITPLLPTEPTTETSPILDVGNCTQHRTVLVQMSAIIQAVALHCPTAVIWNYVGEGKISPHLIGSPLDHLPLPPSILPMAPRFSNNHIRQLLRETEARIRQRSKAAEVRWSLDKLSPPSSITSSPNKQSNCPPGGIITTLQVLEALDRHCFDRVDSSNNIDTLYSKIFQSVVGNKKTSEPTSVETVVQLAKKDEPLVRLLCQWAVSDQRYGEHRALATAQLLDKRQVDLVALLENETVAINGNNDSEESPVIAGGSTMILQPVYQGFLMKFLDSEAPTINDSASGHNSRAVFSSLVHLFHELIKHEVFSHDLYLRTLISRGDLLSVGPNSNGSSSASTSHVHLAGPPSSGINTISGFQSINNEMDDSKIDDDLGKLLQHIKEEQQIVMDAPDSPKDESSHGGLESASSRVDKECKRQSRHLLFTTHFPLPQDDLTMVHDSNQRHILLYGVGKAREESRHAVKKISKEVCRLFHKKLAIDVQAEGTSLLLGGGTGCFSGVSSKPRKHSSRFDFNFELSMQRFLGLSYFDRHAVCTQAASACLEMISSFTGSGTAYLPVLEHISFLFDLFEVSLSISGLIDLCLQLLKELPEVELLLFQRNSVLSRSYLTNVGLYIVGVLRRFHCCLLLSLESTAVAFESLCRIVKHVTNPADCSSAERCILAYLFDLYSCCSFLKVKNHQLDSSIGCSGRDGGVRGSAGGGEVFAFSNAYPKIKQTIFAPVQPSAAVHPQNREFLQEFISNPRRKPEGHVLRQLSDSAQLRYSFVCNVVVAVCNETDNDRLNDIALLCAELTAGCSALSAEWLGVLTALCYSASTYIDVLTQVDVQDNAIHHNLAVLFSVLLARHCFGLQDFLLYVGVPSLVKIWNEGGRSDVDPEAEAGARLTCHLVLRLFKTSDAPHPACYSNTSHSVNVSPHVNTLQQSPSPSLGVKLACDRHLLAATHNSISVGPVLAVLKAILVLADRVPVEGKGGRSAGNNNNSTGSSRSGSGISMTNEVSISHILGTSWSGDLDLDVGSNNFGMGGGGRNNLGGNAECVALATYARCVLKQICSQPWVHQRCLQNPEELLKPDGLLDSCLSFRQAQRLLQMISRPDLSASAAEEITNTQQDSRKMVNRVLDSLDQWRLRVAWLDLQLLCQQLAPSSSVVSSTAEMNQLLDIIARAVLDVFELSQPIGVKEEGDSSCGSNALKKRAEAIGGSSISGCLGKSFLTSSVSLIAPLVSKLPGSVQGRILKVASQVLETCNWNPPTKTKKEDKERSVSGSMSVPTAIVRPRSLLSYEPLLSLVMTCLKGQDEQRESFLSSLYSQLSHFIFLSKEDRLFQGEDMKARRSMLEALQLRFSLVGGLYDSLLKNPTAAIDWAVLFAQLVTTGVIDLSNNTELFDTLQDMLATLLHSTLVLDGQSDRGDDGRKYYPVLIKKLKKELAERKSSPSIQCIKKLLPLPKLSNEFVTCEPYGTLTDTKGNKISDFDSNDKKQGYRLHEKQRVSPWEILEGQKTAAPLSWAWFGAVRIERKPLRHQEVQRLLRHHTHSLQKPASYYLEHPILPPEEIEPPIVIEKVMMSHQPKEEISTLFKMEIPTSDQSPRGGNKRGQKTSQRRPRGRRGAANAAAAAAAAAAATSGMGQSQTSMGVYHNPAGSGMYPPPPQGPHQWNSYQGPQSTPASSQQQQSGTVPTPSASFFPPHQISQGVGGPRFPTERPGSQSRQAISNMLRQRHPGAQQHPGNQFIPGPSQTPVTVPAGSSGPGLAAGGTPVSAGAPQNMIGNARVPVGPGVASGATVGVVTGQQPPFSNLSIVDKQRQQHFMRQQVRQQQAGGGNTVFGQPGGPQSGSQTGQQSQLQPAQQQPQLSMGQGGFSNIHSRQQSFNNFQGGAQPGVMQPQGQVQPQAAQQQQQSMMGQHFNQGAGGNFPIQQQVQIQTQHQGRAGSGSVRAPFMQASAAGMSVGGGQPNAPFPVVRGASMPANANQQQQVRLQHQQMVAMQQMQHGMGQQPQQTPQQHYHQQF